MKTITNRNGKLIIDDSLLTKDVVAVLSELNKYNTHMEDQTEIECILYDAEEFFSDFDKVDVETAVAIVATSKNYAITDPDRFIDTLSDQGVDIQFDRATGGYLMCNRDSYGLTFLRNA